MQDKHNRALPMEAMLVLQATQEVFVSIAEMIDDLEAKPNYGHKGSSRAGKRTIICRWCERGLIKTRDGKPAAFFITDTRFLGGGSPRWMVLREAWEIFVPPSLRGKDGA